VLRLFYYSFCGLNSQAFFITFFIFLVIILIQQML